jgi:hypothetical protein
MARSANRPGNSHWFTKTLLVIGAGVCLILGVIGILLPIIPGLLFLFLALWLTAKASRRAARFLDEHPAWRKQQRFWDRARFLTWYERAQLGVLLAGRLLLDGAQDLGNRLSGLHAGRSRKQSPH